jgi:hypothetical protein
VNLDERPGVARQAEHVHDARVRFENLDAVGDGLRRVGAEDDELVGVEHEAYAELRGARARPRRLRPELFEHVGARLVVGEGEET